MHTRRNFIQVKIRDLSDLGAISYKNYSPFFFFSKEVSICILGLCKCYLKFFAQKRRYWIQVKILDQSDQVAFSYKIDTSFFFFFHFFQIILLLFLGPLNVLITSFNAHPPKFDSGQNLRTVRPRGDFVQKLLAVILLFYYYFVFCAQSFPLASSTSIYALYKLSCKNDDIGFRSKFLINRTQGHFRTKLIRVSFFFLFFSF